MLLCLSLLSACGDSQADERRVRCEVFMDVARLVAPNDLMSDAEAYDRANQRVPVAPELHADMTPEELNENRVRFEARREHAQLLHVFAGHVPHSITERCRRTVRTLATVAPDNAFGSPGFADEHCRSEGPDDPTPLAERVTRFTAELEERIAQVEAHCAESG